MRKYLLQFLTDESASVPLEWAMIATVLVLVAVSGYAAQRGGASQAQQPVPVRAR